MNDMRRIGPRTVPALGAGTWAIGGEWDVDDRPAGWGAADDAESTAGLRAAYGGGMRLFDTAEKALVPVTDVDPGVRERRVNTRFT